MLKALSEIPGSRAICVLLLPLVRKKSHCLLLEFFCIGWLRFVHRTLLFLFYQISLLQLSKSGSRSIFTLSDTEGTELPPSQLPEWDAETALRQLHIRQVPFTELNANIQGYSRGREVAVNRVAVNPMKTLMHEIGHIVLGHTVPEGYKEYVEHRGLKEFEAEATAYLTLNELDRLDEQTATVSRGYIRDWLRNTRPPDTAIRRVFNATDQILERRAEVSSGVVR